MKKYIERLWNGLIKENPVLVLMLGMCRRIQAECGGPRKASGKESVFEPGFLARQGF